MALPTFVVLKSNYNDKYLRYTKEDGPKHRFLQFSGEEVDSPYVKYEVESAKSGQGLVNIRCCYNNKYWVASSENPGWIVAEAEKPDEDKSNSSCTLFEPIVVDEKAQFLHVHLGHYARLWVAGAGGEFNSCLFAGSEAPKTQQYCDSFTIIDWESLVILPKGLKRVAFKGDNGKYLSLQWIEKHPYLQFSCSDIEHPTVANEIIPTGDGSVRIKSTSANKFWRLSPCWIWADSDDTSCKDSDTFFWPIKVDNNTIALRNLGNNKFCKRLTTEGKDSCLNAAEDRITSEGRLVVEELLLSRTISNIQYRLMDARTYGQQVVTMAKASACNKTQEASSIELKVGYAKKESKTWNTSVSLKLGISTTIEAGIPVLVDGKINISTEIMGTKQWGETKETTEALEFKYTNKVGPMTKVTATVLATVASFDVPFSYTQTELLSNGKRAICNMDDGVFTGIACYDINQEVEEKKLM